jgi:hypothetical protein
MDLRIASRPWFRPLSLDPELARDQIAAYSPHEGSEIAMDDIRRKRLTERRIRVEWGACALAAGLAILTVILPTWIETVFGVDPDHANGSAEWAIVALLATVTTVTGALANFEHKRLATRMSPLPMHLSPADRGRVRTRNQSG